MVRERLVTPGLHTYYEKKNFAESSHVAKYVLLKMYFTKNAPV